MPKTRTDTDIQADVEDALEWAANFDEDDIDVDVKDGMVTLTGTVDSYFARRAAEDVALGVFGVTAIINEIDVFLPSAAERTDDDLEEAALYALTRDVVIPSGKLFVTVSHGIVTLQGQVDWNYQREDAEDVFGAIGRSQRCRQSYHRGSTTCALGCRPAHTASARAQCRRECRHDHRRRGRETPLP